MEHVNISGEVANSRIKSASGGAGRDPNPKSCVVSYSLTGNNEALATHVAQALGADHLRLIESSRRTIATVVFDVIFGRTPAIELDTAQVGQCELVIFIGPVWMGQVATPFRSCLQEMQSMQNEYAYVSICGGADGPNPGLRDELCRRVGREPASVIELRIADLLASGPRPKRKDTMAYRLNEGEVNKLTNAVVEAIARRSSQRRRA